MGATDHERGAATDDASLERRGARVQVSAAVRRRATAWALVLAVGLGAAGAAEGQVERTREYQIKAGFLFNFGQFVQWLPEALPPEGAPFVIGVLGEDPFGETLDAIVSGQRIQGREAAVARFARVEEVDGCQVLFVSESEGDRLDEVLGALAGRSILTVGDVPDFARTGMIGFVIVDNRLRLQINTGAAEAADLAISSKLLQLADVVYSDR